MGENGSEGNVAGWGEGMNIVEISSEFEWKPDRSHEPECRYAQHRYRQKKKYKERHIHTTERIIM